MTGLILTKLNPTPIIFALLVTNRGPTPTLTCIIKSDDTRVTEAAVTFKLTMKKTCLSLPHYKHIQFKSTSIKAPSCITGSADRKSTSCPGTARTTLWHPCAELQDRSKMHCSREIQHLQYAGTPGGAQQGLQRSPALELAQLGTRSTTNLGDGGWNDSQLTSISALSTDLKD